MILKKGGKTVKILCKKTIWSMWGEIIFVEGRIYEGKKSSHRVTVINELGGPHTLDASWKNKWFRNNFKFISKNAKEEIKLFTRDQVLIDSMIVTSRLFGYCVKEEMYKCYKHEYSLLYTFKHDEKKTTLLLKVDKKMKIKKVLLIVFDKNYIIEVADINKAHNYLWGIT